MRSLSSRSCEAVVEIKRHCTSRSFTCAQRPLGKYLVDTEMLLFKSCPLLLRERVSVALYFQWIVVKPCIVGIGINSQYSSCHSQPEWQLPSHPIVVTFRPLKHGQSLTAKRHV